MSHFFARPDVSKGIPEAEQLTTLWTLRALVPLGGHMQFVSRHGVASDPLARQIGFDEWIDGESEDFNLAAARKQLRQRHDEAERDHFAAMPPKRLRENVVRLAKLINLTPAECRIVEFSVLLQCEQILEEALETLGSMSRTKMISSMATLLNLPNGEVHVALASNGVLARSGIVTLDSAFASSLKVSLSLLSQQFANVMLDEDAEPTQLLRDVVSMSPPSELQSASFPHVEDSLAVLRPLLRKSLNHEREGVNILIYGPPGTGKTELTRVLALELETDLFEISSQNQEGDPLKPEERLRAYRAAQTLLKKRRALLIFDEIEDVFEGNDFPTSVKHGKTSRKAWINRTLEVNIIPTFWLSNDIGSMDRAFLRRFDLIMELPIPPQSQREKIIAKHCGGFLSPDQQASLARVDHLAPALISRAASIISLVRTEFSEVRVAPTFRMILNGTLQAQGHTRIRENDPSALPDYYDPQFINSDCDLKEVANGLIRSKAGRVCLYGPPGTGKSAWCRWLANQLGIPIHAKKASN